MDTKRNRADKPFLVRQVDVEFPHHASTDVAWVTQRGLRDAFGDLMTRIGYYVESMDMGEPFPRFIEIEIETQKFDTRMVAKVYSYKEENE